MKLVMSIVYVAVLGVLAHYIGDPCPAAVSARAAFFTVREIGKTAARFMNVWV